MKLTIGFAFEGFRLIAKRPWALPAWGLIYLVGIILAVAVFIPFFLPYIQQAANGSTASSPEFIGRMMMSMIIPYILMVLIFLFTFSIIICAMYRAVLTDEPAGFGFIRLGQDEVRMFLVNLVFFLLLFVALIVVSLIGGILSALFGAFMGAGVGVFIAIIPISFVSIWLMVLMSLYGAQTFDEKKFNLFGTWKLTGGNAWLLFFGYLIATALYILIYLVFFMGVPSLLGVNTQDLAQGGAANIGNMVGLGLFVILYFIFAILVISPAMLAIVYAPAAAAYKAITGGARVKQIEKVF